MTDTAVMPYNQSVRRERQLGVERLRDPERRLSDPEREEMAVAIRAQLCPFCGAGPFTVVAIHVSAMHGISSTELHRALGVKRTESICDPAHSRSMSTMQKELHRDLGAQERNVRDSEDDVWGAEASLADAMSSLLETLDPHRVIETLADLAASAGRQDLGEELRQLLSGVTAARQALRAAYAANPRAARPVRTTLLVDREEIHWRWRRD